MFSPSNYQQRVFEWVKTGTGNAIVNAVAGAGKTTTLIEITKIIPKEAGLLLAFNTHVATTLKERLEGTRFTAKTLHSLGFGLLGKALKMQLSVQEKKYRLLVRAELDAHPNIIDLTTLSLPRFVLQNSLVDLIDFVRLTLTDPYDMVALRDLCDHFALTSLPPSLMALLPTILEEGKKSAKILGIVDYTDMIWLPHVWNLKPKKGQDWLLIDECQDLNLAQLELVINHSSPTGRMLFVGDPKQSIMGFGGADSHSFEKIKQRVKAIELPLSITYRCPKLHVTEAQKIVPAIQAKTDALQGTIRYESPKRLIELARAGDLILCRKTAPLIKACIEFIRHNKSALVRGRDIGEDLKLVLDEVIRYPNYEYSRLPSLILQYRQRHLAFLAQIEADEAIRQSLLDRIECLLVCFELFIDARNHNELTKRIEGLFADKEECVIFSSVHRAKGLESERVFIIEPEVLPLTWENQQKWQYEQEVNLKYVALTRSKHDLILLTDKPVIIDEKRTSELEEARKRVEIFERLYGKSKT